MLELQALEPNIPLASRTLQVETLFDVIAMPLETDVQGNPRTPAKAVSIGDMSRIGSWLLEQRANRRKGSDKGWG